MARIRSIKPEFWSDERLASVSRDARLLFIGLLNLADDFGVMRGNPRLLKGQVFPFDDVDIGPLLAELEGIRRIVRYRPEGEDLLFIVNFTKHQKIDKREKLKLPLPPGFVIREEQVRDVNGKASMSFRVVEEVDPATLPAAFAEALRQSPPVPADKTAEPAGTAAEPADQPGGSAVGAGSREQGKEQGAGSADSPFDLEQQDAGTKPARKLSEQQSFAAWFESERKGALGSEWSEDVEIGIVRLNKALGWIGREPDDALTLAARIYLDDPYRRGQSPPCSLQWFAADRAVYLDKAKRQLRGAA